MPVFFEKSVKSVYGMYGRHFTTKYIVDSGSTNLAGAKMYIGWKAGFNFDYWFNKNWGVRYGIAGNIHFVDEIFYGVTAVPDTILKSGQLKAKTRIPAQALLDPLFIERISVGIPLKAIYKIRISKKFEVNLAGGLYLNFYFPTRDEDIRQSIPLTDSSAPYGYYYTNSYKILRDFNRKKILKRLSFSKPFLEWQFDVEALRKFKRSGAIVAGIKTHIGTTKLEKAEFITWPEFSDYRSKGHFILNRSYIGVYAGYRFGSNITK